MKILYGVQGTGNGHISRASAMAEAFKSYPELEVEWILSGRDKSLGCGGIEEFHWREGMTFVTSGGKISILQTLKKNNLSRFRRDVNSLDLRPYDLIISDFEPVLSHAARKQKRQVIGIGHQYAFGFDIPKAGTNPLVNLIMQKYAPVSVPVGLHWHHFGFPILPPIIDIELPASMPPIVNGKVIVYLPFENLQVISDIFQAAGDFECYIYHPAVNDNRDAGHLHYRMISRTGFKKDLLDARQVITNSGFELISECLQFGKNILTKPLHGQMEQLSNARALQDLGYAEVINRLDKTAILPWLAREKPVTQLHYPDVASRLARWIAEGCTDSVESLAAELWNNPALNT